MPEQFTSTHPVGFVGCQMVQDCHRASDLKWLQNTRHLQDLFSRYRSFHATVRHVPTPAGPSYFEPCRLGDAIRERRAGSEGLKKAHPNLGASAHNRSVVTLRDRSTNYEES